MAVRMFMPYGQMLVLRSVFHQGNYDTELLLSVCYICQLTKVGSVRILGVQPLLVCNVWIFVLWCNWGRAGYKQWGGMEIQIHT